MTKNQKYLLGGAATLFVGYLIFFRKSEGGNGVDPTGNGSTFPGSSYVFNAGKVANDLWRAMKDVGTDEEAIFQILTPISASQFVKVVQAFGKSGYNMNTGTNSGIWLEELTLPEWLREELSTSDYNKLKTKYPNSL